MTYKNLKFDYKDIFSVEAGSLVLTRLQHISLSKRRETT